MKLLIALVAASAMVAVPAMAQKTTAPGHQVHHKGSPKAKGTVGASRPAAGHTVQKKGPARGTGHAPGNAGEVKPSSPSSYY